MGVLCEVAKSGSAEQVQAELVELMTAARIVKQTSTLTNNTVVRKFNTKLISRIGLRLLPTGPDTNKRKGQLFRISAKNIVTQKSIARALVADSIENEPDGTQNDIEVPDDVEHILEELFGALQDKVKPLSSNSRVDLIAY